MQFLRMNRPSVSNHIRRFLNTDKQAPKIPKNVLEEAQSSQHQQENGVIYDKKPFKTRLEEGKIYSWCLCGKSKTQPFCDGTHKNTHMKIKLKPIRIKVDKTDEYWLCTCKQTKNRPFCDGTHKQPSVQQAIK